MVKKEDLLESHASFMIFGFILFCDLPSSKGLQLPIYTKQRYITISVKQISPIPT